MVAARSSGLMSRYLAMDSALDCRFSCERRTSLGEPVEPDVLSRRARSGCSSCRVPGRRSSRTALPVPGPDNDVGVIGRDERFQGGGLVLRHEDQRVPADEGRQVGHERVDVVGCGQRDEAPFGTEPDGQLVDAVRQLPVGEGRCR